MPLIEDPTNSISIPYPSLADLGGEPAGAAAAAIATHKQESDPHAQYLLDVELVAHIQSTNPHQLTIQEIGGEPAGAETRAKTYTDGKVAAIVIPPAPTLSSLGGEPAGAAAAAIATHKQESDPHAQYLLDVELVAHIQSTNPHQLTIQEIGGEPAGAETRAKTYTDGKVAAIVIPPAPTLSSLGGEPAGAETRAKTYTDGKIQAVNEWIKKLEGLYPSHLVHFWGYGRAFNGASLKIFDYQTATNYDYYRYAFLTSAALGDTVEFDAVLRPGNYRLRVIHDKNADRGIVGFYVNGILLGTIDCYASAKVNVNRADFSFDTTEVKSNLVRVMVIGKNAASSGFRYGSTAVFIYPRITASPYQLISCGDFTDYFSSDGRHWQTDRNFSGGNPYDIEANVGPFTVANTNDQRLYKWERSLDNGTFTYTIPLTAGLYCVKLQFAENFHNAAGVRVGSVSINGSVVLPAFDIFAQAGGKNRALIKQFDNINVTTNLIIAFTNTLINAIEIIRL